MSSLSSKVSGLWTVMWNDNCGPPPRSKPIVVPRSPGFKGEDGRTKLVTTFYAKVEPLRKKSKDLSCCLHEDWVLREGHSIASEMHKTERQPKMKSLKFGVHKCNRCQQFGRRTEKGAVNQGVRKWWESNRASHVRKYRPYSWSRRRKPDNE